VGEVLLKRGRGSDVRMIVLSAQCGFVFLARRMFRLGSWLGRSAINLLGGKLAMESESSNSEYQKLPLVKIPYSTNKVVNAMIVGLL